MLMLELLPLTLQQSTLPSLDQQPQDSGKSKSHKLNAAVYQGKSLNKFMLLIKVCMKTLIFSFNLGTILLLH